MKKVLFVVAIITTCFISGCGKSAPQKQQTTDDIGSESLVQEKDSPLLFMDVEAKIKKAEDDESGNKEMIYGTISNTAMQTKFKDITLNVKYYSGSNDLIESTDIIVYKFFEPNSRTKFELNINPPDSMKTYEVHVKDAKAVGEGAL